MLGADLAHVLAHSGSLWEELRARRIFITGGTGFFGCWLLEAFCHANRTYDLGAHAVVLTRTPRRFADKAPHLASDRAITLVQGDVRDFTASALAAQLAPAERRMDFVVHAATEASAALLAEQPLLMLDTIVRGTRSALDLAVATGARRLLLTSSGAVYGLQPGTMTHVPETYAGAPDAASAASAYGEGKRIAETMCACYASAHGIDSLIARCFAFVGPYLPLDTHFAIGNFIRDAMGGEAIRVGGDGTPTRSYLYAADLAIWLWTILLRGTSGRPYNVGSGREVTIAALARTVGDAADPPVPVHVARTPVPGANPHRYVPDVARAEAELGLREWIPLEAAIERTIDWHRRTAGRQ
jgi:dTDP-glucose 4,6-dehydratase